MKVDLGLTSRSNTEYIMLYYQIIFSLLDFYVNVARTTTCYKSGWTSMYKVKLDWDQTSIPVPTFIVHLHLLRLLFPPDSDFICDFIYRAPLFTVRSCLPSVQLMEV